MKNSVRRAWFYQLAAALVFVASLVLVNANVEVGMNDDWSFIFTARNLATTRHLHYNGWSAPLIGFQAYWAALFLKVFGFSFLMARASVWILALLSIPVLWRLLRSVEIPEGQALFGVLFFLLSPLVLPHLATFMTDLPAFFLFAAALLCALKAWEFSTERTALLWMAASAACGMASGSIRQIYWLSGICFLGVLGLTKFRSVRGRACALIGILLTLVFGGVGSYWLAHQPYVPADDTVSLLRNISPDDALTALREVARGFIGLTVLSIPLTLPLAFREVRRIPAWVQCLIPVAAALLASSLADPMPWLGNTLTKYGVVLSGSLSLGDKPVVLADTLMLFLALVGLTSVVYALTGVLRQRQSLASRFFLLTAPFLALYTLVLVIRSPVLGIFDRYLIPHLFVGTVLLLMQARESRRLSLVALTTGSVFMLYALATTHDYFAEARAKLTATQEVLRAGHDSTSVISSLEFNSWAQMERTGHVNNESVRFPHSGYRQIDDCSGPDDTLAWWRSMEPDLSARYVVTLSPLPGLEPSEFAPVEYGRWLPLGNYQIYVQAVQKGSPALTCKPDTGS